MLKVYGLKNCDTCRKALKWLKESGVDHEFADLRQDGFAETDLQRWIDAASWEILLNRRGTTWRGLSETERAGVNTATAGSLMQTYPALIKRPVFDLGGDTVIVGFGNKEQQALKAHLEV